MLEECSNVLNDYSGRTKYKYINKFLLMDENEIAFKKRFKKDLNEIKNDIKQIDDCFKKSSKTANGSDPIYSFQGGPFLNCLTAFNECNA